MTSTAGAPAAVRTGWYLYGIVPADAAPDLPAGVSVDPAHDVVLLAEGRLAGLASRVSLEEFDEATLTERLGDAVWLEQKIRAHEQVLEQVLAGASVIPCRFCTVYRSEDELRRFLAERREQLAEALGRLHGLVELGLKAFIDREDFAAGRARQNEAIRELDEKLAGAEGGRAYLERRRLEQLVAAELDRFRAEFGQKVHAELLSAAEDGVALPLQRPEVSGRDEEMLFNAAYLVPGDRVRFEQALTQLAHEHRDAGVDFELTGPWPPYNFVPRELGQA